MAETRFGIIYEARNKINGKRYIGQTIKFLARRRSEHEKHANHYNGPFQRALRKYGNENFAWRVICKKIPENQLNLFEVRWIAQLRPEYNCTIGGEGLRNPSIETRKRLSRAMKIAMALPKNKEHHKWAMKIALARPKTKALKSRVSKAIWVRLEYRVKHAQSMKAAWSKKVRSRFARKIKNLWKKPEYRASHERPWKDPKICAKHALAVKIACSRPDEYARKSQSMKNVWIRRKLEA